MNLRLGYKSALKIPGVRLQPANQIFIFINGPSGKSSPVNRPAIHVSLSRPVCVLDTSSAIDPAAFSGDGVYYIRSPKPLGLENAKCDITRHGLPFQRKDCDYVDALRRVSLIVPYRARCNRHSSAHKRRTRMKPCRIPSVFPARNISYISRLISSPGL